MELRELLGIRPGLTAVIGSGGKTSMLRVLAQELSKRGTVLLATTTHILCPNWCPFAATESELRQGFARSRIVCAGSFTADGKLTVPSFPDWQSAADFVLVEADGSKRLPAKAHAPWEPVLPAERNLTVCVFGASALGTPIQTAAHRSDLYAELAEVPTDTPITSEIAARVLAKEGGFDVLFINQSDTLTDPAAQLQAFDNILPCSVVYGSLEKKMWRQLQPPKNTE